MINKNHTERAVEIFGTTYYKTRAGFILTDGRLLDLTYDGGPRDDHRAIQDAFDDQEFETSTDYLIAFMNEGNIRLIPEIPGIDISTSPTHEQWAALKDYIQYWISKKHHFEIQFSNSKGEQVDWQEFNGFKSVNEILYTIADHFDLKLIEGVEPHQNDKTYSKYIINPEENYDLASKITPIIDKHQNITQMKRDNCLPINRDLLFDLEKAGYKFELTSGYFICDNVNITDVQDLKYLKKYNEYKQSGLTIPEFIIKNNYFDKGKGWFTYIPHWWLQLGGLIVDRAWPMFKKALEKPITAENYTSKDFNEGFTLHKDTRAQLIVEAIKNNKTFNINKTGVWKYDQWLLSQDARNRDNVNLEIKYMTPREYFEACGKLFGNNFESQVRQIKYDSKINKELEQVYDSNQLMNLTVLDYVSRPNTQEGRHRMYVLAMKYGWDKVSYPVAVFTIQDQERADREELERQQEKLYKYINRSIMLASDFSYKNYEELAEQLEYYLSDYIDNPEVKISERGMYNIVVIVNGLEYEVPKDQFIWENTNSDLEASQDDYDELDLLDLDDLDITNLN